MRLLPLDPRLRAVADVQEGLHQALGARRRGPEPPHGRLHAPEVLAEALRDGEIRLVPRAWLHWVIPYLSYA